jgi:hypothetical protein
MKKRRNVACCLSKINYFEAPSFVVIVNDVKHKMVFAEPGPSPIFPPKKE